MERATLQDDGPKGTFYAIDGHWMIHRSFHSQLDLELNAPDGTPTKAIYIFVKSLMKLIREHKPSHFAICFDASRAGTFRRQLSPTYKAQRGASDPDFITQIRWIRKIVGEIGLVVYEDPLYEADDLIGTLVHHSSAKALNKVIISRDRDLHQLVAHDVRMYDPIGDEWFTVESVEKKWKAPVHLIPTIKALMGDPGDGIEGIAGIGEVGATAIANRFGCVDEILVNLPALTPRQRRAIQDGDLRLQEKLVTIVRNVPLHLDWDKLRIENINLEGAAESFRTLGFRQWADMNKWVRRT